MSCVNKAHIVQSSTKLNKAHTVTIYMGILIMGRLVTLRPWLMQPCLQAMYQACLEAYCVTNFKCDKYSTVCVKLSLLQTGALLVTHMSPTVFLCNQSCSSQANLELLWGTPTACWLSGSIASCPRLLGLCAYIISVSSTVITRGCCQARHAAAERGYGEIAQCNATPRL